MRTKDILMAPGAVVLLGLNDVNIDNPLNGQTLTYNLSTQKWENKMPSGAGGYVDRGDPSSDDFSKTDFTIDGDWHTLDLSSIVPEGATVVHIAIKALTAFNDQTIVFCKNGITNKKNGETIRVPHGAKEYFESAWVACDSDRKVQYWISNVTWVTLDALIRGWIV